MSRLSTLLVLAVLAVAVGVGGWWLFRTETDDNAVVGLLRYSRRFGRVVLIEADRDRDGRWDMRVRYPWSQPYEGNLDGPGCLDPGRTAEDRNHDGRWDTWYHAVGENDDGRCVYSYAVDLDLDGKPDWTFAEVNGAEAFAAIREKRGF